MKRIILFLLFLSTNALSQPYYFTHFMVEDGLSNNSVLCSMQDKMGFMWFGTKDGLNRFDGYSFTVFRGSEDEHSNLGSNLIRVLYEDNKGDIWVGTDQGIFIFDPRIEEFSLFNPSIVNEILDIKGDSNGNIWFIDDLTLYKYGDDTLTQITTDYHVSSLSISYTGIWCGTAYGNLVHFDPVQNSFSLISMFSHSSKTGSKWIEKIYDTGKNYLIIGTTKNGIKIYDIETKTYKDILNENWKATDLFIRDIIESNDDEYWIATESGIYVYNYSLNKVERLHKQNGNPWALSDNVVYTLYKDTENGIWAGTYFGGINYFTLNNTFFEKYFPLNNTNSIAGSAVREICADESGNIWIGTEDEGLSKLNVSTNQITNYKPTQDPNSLSYSNIHGLLTTGNTLWVGTFEHGLDLLDIKTGKVKKHYEAQNEEGHLKNNFIFNIHKTKSKQIFLATGKGLYEYDENHQKFHLNTNFPSYIFYTTLFEDSNGTLWAGTWRDGLFYYNFKTGQGGRFQHKINNQTGLPSNRINRIFEDSNHRIWIATEGGLSRFDHQSISFINYTIRKGMPSNLILAMLEDSHKNMWVTTSKGLVRFNLETEDIKIFTQSSGLLSNQFNYNSAYKDDSGNMYFGSVRGMIRFNPDNYKETTYQPPIYITGFQVYQQDLEINKKGSPLSTSIVFTDQIELKYNQATFSIDFAALSYAAPEMTEYIYKMEGLDKEWTKIRTNRKVYFTELKPGDYIFKVNVINDKGEPKGEEAQLHIKILPPYWASNMAYFLYFLILAFVINYSFKSYHLKIRERNRRKLESINNRKEKELYSAKIDFFTNVAHEIRTPLTLIKAPLEKVMKLAAPFTSIHSHLNTMERNTERLIELTDQLLDFRKTEEDKYRLIYNEDDINLLLQETYTRFKTVASQKGIDLKLTMPSSVVKAEVDKDAVVKIISNLLSNGLKYAESSVHVHLEEPKLSALFFTIMVESDGDLIPTRMKEKIFESFYRLKETSHQHGSGLGLALSRSLAELHNGRLFLDKTALEMNRFILILPIKQN